MNFGSLIEHSLGILTVEWGHDLQENCYALEAATAMAKGSPSLGALSNAMSHKQ